MIKVENIKGSLFLVGADDDSFWGATRSIVKSYGMRTC